MAKIKYSIIVITGVICVAGLWLSGFWKQARMTSPGANLPDKELVFTMHPDGVMGFVDAQGGEIETREFVIPMPVWGPIKVDAPYINGPYLWSLDGESIGFRISGIPNGGLPVLVSTAGEFLTCESREVDGVGRVQAVSGAQIVTVVSTRHQDRDRVVRFDMETCKELEILYQARPDEGISEALLSSQGWLAIQQKHNSQIGILLLDAQGEIAGNIPDGRYPAWSADGAQIAYYAAEGLHIAAQDGSGARRLVQGFEIGGYTAWSPDGCWLAYDRAFEQEMSLFRVNVETLENVLILKGGMGPSWRWAE